MTSSAARAAVLPSVLSLLALAVPAADAQSLGVEDPAGDSYRDKLDITTATAHNHDYRLVARVGLAEMEKGSVIVSVDRRKGSGVRLVTKRRADGTVRSLVLPGAFTDTQASGDVTCPRFRARWDDEASTVVLRMPSRCWNDGDYGAVRFAVLTENGGGDVDWAPADEDGEIGSSAWVARG